MASLAGRHTTYRIYDFALQLQASYSVTPEPEKEEKNPLVSSLWQAEEPSVVDQ